MKKARNLNSFLTKSSPLWSVLFLVLFSTSCKDDIEGCKDISASNWNSAADSSCEDCCTYPELKLSFTHVYGDTTFRYGELYEDDYLNIYSISSIRYYMSNFSFSTASDSYIVTDSLETTLVVDGASETATIHDDAVFATVGTSITSIGDFPSTNLYLDSLSFSLGLAQPLNTVDPGSVPGSHPLAPKADSMYWDESRGYIFQRLEIIIPDTTKVDTILLEIGGDDLLTKVNIPYGKTTLTGFDQIIPINVDYKCWFTGINFAKNTKSELKEKIVNNMSKSFSISE